MLKIIYKLIPGWFKIYCYKLSSRRPWGHGYFTFKFQYIKKAINNHEVIKKFKNSEFLPERYGYAIDERVVEYPWVLSRIPSSNGGNLLDAGSVLNFKEILEFPALKNKKINIVNLNLESNCFLQKGISYVLGDIRHLPFKDNYFDYITCISTLEHIGMDNTLYTKDVRYKEEKKFDFEKAVLELKRVLKKDGNLFITVPFGKYENFGRFQQFDSKLINRILEILQSKQHQVSYYKYTEEGWNISYEISCKNSEYFDVYKTKYFDKKSSLGFNTDCAAASRAIACFELIK